MSKRMLLVEDDPAVAQLVAREFRARGWAVSVATQGAEAITLLRQDRPAVIVLDVGLPDTTGFDVCRQIRQAPLTTGIPIIFLSARNEEVDRVVGLELGADDYIGKPFSIRELEARIRAVLRRSGRPSTPSRLPTSAVEPPALLVFEDLTIDSGSRSVLVDGREVKLRAREFELLLALARSPGQVHRRADLLRQIWTYDSPTEVVTRTVDVHVRRLRLKLGSAGWHIETMKGVGYRFVAERG